MYNDTQMLSSNFKMRLMRFIFFMIVFISLIGTIVYLMISNHNLIKKVDKQYNDITNLKSEVESMHKLVDINKSSRRSSSNKNSKWTADDFKDNN